MWHKHPRIFFGKIATGTYSRATFVTDDTIHVAIETLTFCGRTRKLPLVGPSSHQSAGCLVRRKQKKGKEKRPHIYIQRAPPYVVFWSGTVRSPKNSRRTRPTFYFSVDTRTERTAERPRHQRHRQTRGKDGSWRDYERNHRPAMRGPDVSRLYVFFILPPCSIMKRT